MPGNERADGRGGRPSAGSVRLGKADAAGA